MSALGQKLTSRLRDAEAPLSAKWITRLLMRSQEHGGVATLFVKSGDQYVRVATTVKKEDGTSAVGTALDVKKAAISRLNNGEAYYGDATVFGKTYDAGYEPIKDASGAVNGAYFVGHGVPFSVARVSPRQSGCFARWLE